jgi:DNA polymerase delta subunit 1
MLFQFVNWHDDDNDDEYVIRGFGYTELGASVCLKLIGFKPYFYVRKKYFDLKFIDVIKKATFGFSGFAGYTTVYKKPFVGYQRSTETFYKLSFNSIKGFRYAAKILRNGSIGPSSDLLPIDPLGLFETHIPPIVRPMHYTGIRSTGWCSCPDEFLQDSDKETEFDHEFHVPYEFVTELLPIDRDGFAPVKIATFDIEVYSSDSTATHPVFPSFLKKGDQVIAIVTFFSKITEEVPYCAHIVCMKGIDTDGHGEFIDWTLARGIPSCEVKVCDTEAALLNCWAYKMQSEQALVWVHFNGLGFDEEYLYMRAVKCGALGLLGMDFVENRSFQVRKSVMESNAYGYNSFSSLDQSGIFHLDIMIAIKKDYKLDKYSLEHCGQHFLQETKTDLKPQAQFDLFRKGFLKEICLYCLQDVWLTYELYKKLALGPAMLEMAGQSWVPVNYLITRGQQVKMLSSIVQFTSHKEYLLRTIPNDEVSIEGYKGATVLEPDRGFYTSAIACLDFASLYPSIIRAHNLSHETLVTNRNELPPGIETYIVEIPMKDLSLLKVEFVQESGLKGILPQILESWARDRKRNKNEMLKFEKLAHESDDKSYYKFMESVYDARQKANKVSMNSLYGFTGVGTGGSQPCPQIAACVTTLGRSMIETTKRCCEEMLPGSKIIYGDTDSVFWDLWPDKQVQHNPDIVSEAFKFCEAASKELSENFKTPNKLEFEKVYCPLLLFEKKRYSGLLYSADLGPTKPKKIENKGLQVVRRDTIEYVKTCMDSILKVIHYDKSVLKATQLAKRMVEDLFNGKVPLDQLIFSKKINSQYKVQLQRDNGSKEQIVINPMGTWHYPLKGGKGTLLPVAGKPWNVLDHLGVGIGTVVVTHPHVHILWKQEERCPGSGARPGDRVNYVFVENTNSTLQYTKAEDYHFAMEKAMPIDTIYYYTNALKSPLETIFQLFFDDVHEKLFGSFYRKAVNKSRKQPEISNFFVKRTST